MGVVDILTSQPFIVGLLTGGVGGAIVTQLVTYIRRPKTWLSYSLARTNIVTRGHSQLVLRFQNQLIDRLDSHVVTLTNSGNQPLQDLTINLECPSAATILEHAVQGPAGFDFAATPTASNELSVRLVLLNPGETFTVALSVADMNQGAITVLARAPNLVLKRVTTGEVELAISIAGGGVVASLTNGFVRAVLGLPPRRGGSDDAS